VARGWRQVIPVSVTTPCAHDLSCRDTPVGGMATTVTTTRLMTRVGSLPGEWYEASPLLTPMKPIDGSPRRFCGKGSTEPLGWGIFCARQPTVLGRFLDSHSRLTLST
jgi:hypothetical protein